MSGETEQGIITEAFVRQLGAHAMVQTDGSIKIGWGTLSASDVMSLTRYVVISFQDGMLSMVELKTVDLASGGGRSLDDTSEVFK